MFSMVQHHKYSISELENCYPFERDLYVDMLLEYLESQKEEQHGTKKVTERFRVQ